MVEEIKKDLEENLKFEDLYYEYENGNRWCTNEIIDIINDVLDKYKTKEQSKIEKALKHITTMQEEYMRQSDVLHDLMQLERILK